MKLRPSIFWVWQGNAGRAWRCLAAIVLLAACLFPREPAYSQTLQRLPLNIAMSRSSFVGVNQSDAEASFKAFMITIAEKRGYLLEPQTRLFEHPAEIEACIRTNTPHVAVVDAWEYVRMDLGTKVEPKYVVPQVTGLFNTYVLLTRLGSGLDQVAQLRGREILLLESMNAKLGRAWFEVLTRSNTAATRAAAFAQLEIVTKPSLAVLPVFFGRKQACILTQSGFAVMRELNPQVGRELQVIATSDGYMETVICISQGGWSTPKAKEDFMRSLEELHQTPAGQQVLNLFKADRAVAFEPWHLDAVRALREEFDRGGDLKATAQTANSP